MNSTLNFDREERRASPLLLERLVLVAAEIVYNSVHSDPRRYDCLLSCAGS